MSVKHFLEVLTDIETIQAKTRKLQGTWMMLPAKTGIPVWARWLVAGLYLASFGTIAALLFYQGWWLFGVATVAVMFNELDKVRAIGFKGTRLQWEDRQRFDADDDLPVIVITADGTAEMTKFKPDRYYRLLRRHRHSFYVDDAIDLPDADPLPAMLWGPYVVILRGEYLYFCKLCR